jgi:hypothetical protein
MTTKLLMSIADLVKVTGDDPRELRFVVQEICPLLCRYLEWCFAEPRVFEKSVRIYYDVFITHQIEDLATGR